jgi:hypothetical protein
MHGTIKAGLLLLSRRDFRQNLVMRIRMAGSAWVFTSFSWLFSLLISALTLLDRGRGLTVLIYCDTKLKADFRVRENNRLEENL